MAEAPRDCFPWAGRSTSDGLRGAFHERVDDSRRSLARMTARASVAVLAALCWGFAAGDIAASDSHGDDRDHEKNVPIDINDSLAKFASSLRNVQRKGLEVLDAAAAEGIGLAAPEGSKELPETIRRRRSHGRRGRGLEDSGAAFRRRDDSGQFKALAYVTPGNEDLVKKKDDESVRVIRIKILHHGRGDGEEDDYDVVRRRPLKSTPCSTPCPTARLLVASTERPAATRRITTSRGRKTKTSKKVVTPKAKVKSVVTKTKAPSTTRTAANCGRDGDTNEPPVEATEHEEWEEEGSEHHHEEPSGGDASEDGAPKNDIDEYDSHADTPPPREDEYHEQEADSEDGTGAGSEQAPPSTRRSQRKTTVRAGQNRGLKAFKFHPRDHLRIHVVHKPSVPQGDVNETFFVNHSVVNKTGRDSLVIKTDDQFFLANGSKLYRVPKAAKNDEREPYLGNQDYVEEFEKRVREVNESLQRIRNYNRPSGVGKRRVRRENVRFMRSLRWVPPEGTPPSKGGSQRSHVVGAGKGNIRIIINRRLDNENGASRVISANPSHAGNIALNANGVRHNIRVLDHLSRAVPMRTVAKRDIVENGTEQQRSNDAFQGLFNNTWEGEAIAKVFGQTATYVVESGPAVSKYDKIRFNALTITCVLAAVLVFVVSVVFTLLYFDIKHLFYFKRSFRYAALDLTEPPLDDCLEVVPLNPQ